MMRFCQFPHSAETDVGILCYMDGAVGGYRPTPGAFGAGVHVVLRMGRNWLSAGPLKPVVNYLWTCVSQKGFTLNGHHVKNVDTTRAVPRQSCRTNLGICV